MLKFMLEFTRIFGRRAFLARGLTLCFFFLFSYFSLFFFFFPCSLSFPPPNSLSHIGEGCHNLQTLCLLECVRVTCFGMQEIALGCPNLKSLNILGCRKVTDEGIIAVGNGCPHLQSLDLVYTISNLGLKQIGIGCLHLCALHISGKWFL